MRPAAPDRILIAGAGIAGLAAAIAFARRGFSVTVFEQAPQLEEIGAGLQLAPNATHILSEAGVLEHLSPHAVEPAAILLRRAADLSPVSRLPVGAVARQRWGAPYLVCHRADLQKALLKTVASHASISLIKAAQVTDFELNPPAFVVEQDGQSTRYAGTLAVAADGVWSTIRAQGGQKGESRYVGQVAWRRSIAADDPAWLAIGGEAASVNAFMAPDFHLIAYPMRGGAQINLVAFTRYRQEMPRGWAEPIDTRLLSDALQTASPALAGLAPPGSQWTAHPLHVADLDGSWSDPGGLALIGDAAHAMTPFAAQGAAMAIEDAETLAHSFANGRDNLPAALTAWTVARRRRVLRVARRGALNQFAWHAAGPVATARDLVLRLRGPQRLLTDLDWLYGWRAER